MLPQLSAITSRHYKNTKQATFRDHLSPSVVKKRDETDEKQQNTALRKLLQLHVPQQKTLAVSLFLTLSFSIRHCVKNLDTKAQQGLSLLLELSVAVPSQPSQ